MRKKMLMMAALTSALVAGGVVAAQAASADSTMPDVKIFMARHCNGSGVVYLENDGIRSIKLDFVPGWTDSLDEVQTSTVKAHHLLAVPVNARWITDGITVAAHDNHDLLPPQPDWSSWPSDC